MAPFAPRPDVPVHFPSHLSPFDKPSSAFLQDHSLSTVSGTACGAVVFDTNDRILLVQRAAHDSQPGKWEAPGGGVDPDDPSLMYAAARELWEEAGLVGTRITRIVPVYPDGAAAAQPALAQRVFPHGNTWVLDPMVSYFSNGAGTKMFVALAFQFADVEPGTNVTLDPNEHQAFRWVAEHEFLAQCTDDGLHLPLAARGMTEMLHQAFKIRREAGEMLSLQLAGATEKFPQALRVDKTRASLH